MMLINAQQRIMYGTKVRKDVLEVGRSHFQLSIAIHLPINFLKTNITQLLIRISGKVNGNVMDTKG